MQRSTRRPLRTLLVLGLLFSASPAAAQVGGINLDTVRAGRFDMGRMWLFENPPQQYFTDTYGFDANDAWFQQARLSVLRIPGCSASFVSANGLVVTNHHCVRSAITRVARAGESLLDDGFYAPALADERRIPDYWADLLISVEDVSDEVFAATDAVPEAERTRARQQVIAAIQQRLRERHAGAGTLQVQVIPLYQGGRYSAYVFRRFTDVRLVVAAELQMGFFGGDPDNFTYPRYALDFAFLRVYDENGEPHRPQHFFTWSQDGVEEGDVVFVIGNPGPTSRLTTVAQLEFLRDVLVPAQIALFTPRLEALRAFYAADPVAADAWDARNRAFSISNTLKAATGRLAALNDPVILAKRQDGERQFLDALRANAALQARYGNVVSRLAEIQASKISLGREYAAFLAVGNASYWPASLRRALLAGQLVHAREAGLPQDTLAAISSRIAAIGDLPAAVEREYLTATLQDFARSLPVGDSIVVAIQGEADVARATAILASSVLGDSARTAAALQAGRITADDPAVRIALAVLPRQAAFAQQWGRLIAEEQELQSQLGRARFEIYGAAIPPDASSSPRITDGVVSGYSYNGTLAPAYTTFYGVYDRFTSFGPATDWNLPARWRTPPAGLDLGTPLNFVSTADTYGGNSGSPAVTPQLEIVGLNFDRNIQGLSRDYIFLPELGRNVMVDVRAIREALDKVYDAHRIHAEITSGTFHRTEAEADAARRTR